jgi:hypothetical protein
MRLYLSVSQVIVTFASFSPTLLPVANTYGAHVGIYQHMKHGRLYNELNIYHNRNSSNVRSYLNAIVTVATFPLPLSTNPITTTKSKSYLNSKLPQPPARPFNLNN